MIIVKVTLEREYFYPVKYITKKVHNDEGMYSAWLRIKQSWLEK